MQFDIIDHNVSTTTNIFLIIANIINLFYNIPQMYKTYKRKSTKDLSAWFLLLRIIGNSIWIEYAIEVNSLLMLINNIVTVLSSMFVGYYKLIEIINDRKINDRKINDRKINDRKINNRKINDRKINDRKINDRKINNIKDDNIDTNTDNIDNNNDNNIDNNNDIKLDEIKLLN